MVGVSPLRSLNGLRAFEAAARHRSFTKAAAELNVSQAAVSHIVRELEERLGVPLFVRHTNSLALTAEGRELWPVLSSAFAVISEAVERVRDSSAGRRQITVGVGASFALRWLMPRLERFREANPAVAVEVAISTSGMRFQEDWTCGVRYGDGNWDGFEVEPLCAPELVPVCTPVLAAGLTRPADLQAMTLLHVNGSPEDWPRWLGANGVPHIRRRLTLPNYATALQAAIDGLGVALTFTSYVADDLRAGRLAMPFPQSVSKGRAWALIYRPSRKGSAEFGAFRDWLVTEIGAPHALPA
jgi:LysR family glycine cleavage system transcriptional activator/LysR family transcriptional regulator of beta-lactamase